MSFNKDLGFEHIESGLDLPLRARFSIKNPKYLRMKELYSAMSHSYYVGKKIKQIAFEKSGILRENVPVIIAKQNGGSDYAGIDNVLLQSGASVSPSLSINSPTENSTVNSGFAGFDVSLDI